MLQLQKRLVDKQPRLIHPNRRFIKEGLLMKCCGILPLQQSIVEVLFGAGGKDATLFRVSAKEQMLMLYSKQPGESENWISALKQAIEELPDHKVLAKENSRPHLKRKPRLYGKRTEQPLSKKQAVQENTNETKSRRRNPESSSCYRDLLVAGLCSGVNNE
ncbi:uncharacterized protein LOC143247399 isoform X5 [Tachypleus tridentatus]|uniref:uncharacterized protein LOC143247399 isoform X5 n=1 Tax=Tachypleus tridentatus TaxID=6853 RepID=UPI003FD30D44